MNHTRPSAADDVGRLLLRLAVAVIVLFHGIYKVTHGVQWMAQPLAAVNLPAFLAYGTYVAEVLAPILLIAGIWTRLAALTIAFDMGMAIFLVLRPQLVFIKPAGGGWGVELEALILLSALAIALIGSGRLALAPSPRRREIAAAPGVMVP